MLSYIVYFLISSGTCSLLAVWLYWKYLSIKHKGIRFFGFHYNPKYPHASKKNIEYAFTSGGVDYFQFSDTFSMPAGRLLVAQNILDDFNNRTSRQFMDAWTDAIETELNAPGGIKLTRVVTLLQALKERRSFSICPETVYEIASVNFFDKTENTLVYDTEYNQRKIAKWKKEPVLAFFLKLPIAELAPFLSQSPESTRHYLRSAYAREIQQLETLYESLSKAEKASDSAKQLLAKIQELSYLMENI